MPNFAIFSKPFGHLTKYSSWCDFKGQDEQLQWRPNVFFCLFHKWTKYYFGIAFDKKASPLKMKLQSGWFDIPLILVYFNRGKWNNYSALQARRDRFSLLQRGSSTDACSGRSRSPCRWIINATCLPFSVRALSDHDDGKGKPNSSGWLNPSEFFGFI